MHRKPRIFMALLLALSSLLGCKKNHDKDLISKEVDAFRSAARIESTSPDQRLLLYNSMSDSARYEYWGSRIDEYLLNNDTLSGEQVALIRELRSRLTYEVYTNPDQREIFKTDFLPGWASRSEAILLHHLYRLAILVNDPAGTSPYWDTKDAPAEDGPTEGYPSCQCNTGRHGDCFFSHIDVRLFTARFHYGFTDCIIRRMCSDTMFGCGWLGLWGCNGSQCAPSH
jgi:hypothetical protein